MLTGLKRTISKEKRMKSIARLVVALGLLMAGLITAASPAQALTFNFTSDHCTGGCGTPPFGSVTLTQNATTVDVTVQVNAPNAFIKTGSSDFMSFKFNGIGVSLGDIVVDAHLPLLAAHQAGVGLDAGTPDFNQVTGSFAFGINCPSCGNGGGPTNRFTADIMFHVLNATIADLTVPNNLGNVFVADIISCNVTQCGSGNGTGNTGPVDATTPVTEPASLGLLGTSLVLVAMLGRRWKRGEA